MALSKEWENVKVRWNLLMLEGLLWMKKAESEKFKIDKSWRRI